MLAIGNEVSGLVVGDGVVATATGMLASHVTVDQRFTVRKPPRLSFESAATIPAAFATAIFAAYSGASAARGTGTDPFRHGWRRARGRAIGLERGSHRLRDGRLIQRRDLLAALGVSHVSEFAESLFADDVLYWTQARGSTSC